MNKKISLVFLLVAATSVLSGCSLQEYLNENAQKFDNKESTSSILQVKNESDNKVMEVSQKIDDVIFDGSALELWYGKEGSLLAQKGDYIYEYDMSSDTITQKVKTGSFNEAQLFIYNDGYCVVSREDSSQGNNNDGFITSNAKAISFSAIMFNNDFKEISRFTLSNLKIGGDGQIAITADGKKLCYLDIWSLYLVDTKTGEEQLLADFSNDSYRQKSFLGPDKIFFNESGDKIIFSGQSDQNGKTVESWGSINIDGTGFVNNILSKDPGAALFYKNGILGMGEISMTSTGDVALIDINTGAENYSGKIVKGRGVDGPIFSDDGAYFAVTKLNGSSVNIDVYETSTFTKVYSNIYKDDNKELFYRRPRVFLTDESRKGMIFMGGFNDIPLVMNSFSF